MTSTLTITLVCAQGQFFVCNFDPARFDELVEMLMEQPP